MLLKKNNIFQMALVGGLGVAIAASVHAGTWVQDGGSLNLASDRDATVAVPAITSTGIPYVAIRQYDGINYQIYVRRYSGGTWTTVGGYLNDDPTVDIGSNFSLAISANGTPYVIATEAQVSRVKHYNGSDWVQDGADLNSVVYPTGAPDLIFNQNTPYAAWRQEDGTIYDIYVRHFDGATWIPDGAVVNVDATKSTNNPSLMMYQGIPWVAFQELGTTCFQVYVKDFSMSSWVVRGDGAVNISVSQNATEPALAIGGNGIPYVVWRENNGAVGQLYVKRLENGAWVSVGYSLNANPVYDTGGQDIAVSSDGTPYVVWHESHLVRMKYFNGTSWVSAGILNIDQTHDAGWPHVEAAQNGNIYVTWRELDAASVYQVYMKHYIPDTPTATVTPTVTATPHLEQLGEVFASPNPSRGHVTFRWTEPAPEQAEVAVYNTAGERVALLAESQPGTGLTWDAQGLAPGIYWYRTTLTLNGKEKKYGVRKLALLKP